MTAVWEQRHAEFVRRVSALRESGALELLPDLMPVLSVLDPAAPELALLRRDRAFHCYVNSPAVAGQNSAVEVLNPTGSNALIVIDSLDVGCDVAASTVLGRWLTGGGLPTGVTVEVDDTRGTGSTGVAYRGIATVRYGAFALAAATYWRAPAPLDPATTFRELGFVVSPGQAFQFILAAVNQQARFTLRYRERAVDPAEMNAGA